MTRRLKLKFDNEKDEVVGKLFSENEFFTSQGNDIKESLFRKSTCRTQNFSQLFIINFNMTEEMIGEKKIKYSYLSDD